MSEFAPFPYQIADQEYLAQHNYTGLLAMEPGAGKGHPLDEPVLTPEGWTPVGNLAPGDEVIGSDGRATQVVNVFDRGVLPTYRVTFRDGSTVRVDGDHLWRVRYTTNGGVEQWRTKSTEHLSRLTSIHTYEIPVTAVHHPEADLPIHPYALGALIADGYLAGNGIQWTKNDLSVAEEMRKAVEASGGILNPRKEGTSATRYGVIGLREKVRALDLEVKSAGKFIPEQYLITSLEQRIQLINGLFDGDGSVRKDRGTASYASMSEQLVLDVQKLLWSVGVGATVVKKTHRKGNYWWVSVHGDFNPFLAHPDRRFVTGTTRNLRRSFKSIERIADEEIRCIQVAAEDHLYVTKDYIVTHNTTTALLAIKNSGSKVTLVVAPDGTHRSAWIPQAQWILGETPRIIANSGLKAHKEAMFDFQMGFPGIYLVTPQLLTKTKDISDWVGDMCIVDEGHYINKPRSLGQKQMQKLAENFPKHRLFLSGTAWRNNFERAWSVMRFCFPNLHDRGEVAWDNLKGWQMTRMMHEETMIPPRKWYPTTWEKYKSPPEGYWRKNIGGVPHIGEAQTAKKWLNESDPGRLLSEAPSVIIHKKREECCEFHTVEAQGYAGFLDMEEPQVIEHVIPLTAKQKRAIKDLESQYLTFLDGNPLIVTLPITMKQRLRQVSLGEPEVENYVVEDDGEEVEKQRLWFKDDCKSPFTDQLMEVLEADEDEPVVVYIESQTFAEVLTRRLNKAGVPAFEFSGKTKKTRDADLQLFGSKYRVAVIVISAGGTGLDGLQKVSKTEVWMERSVDETNNIQARSRQDRLGGRGQVQRHVFKDDLGYADGAYSEALARQLALNATLRKAV